MNAEMSSIVAMLEAVHSTGTWYGKPVMEVLTATDETVVYERPTANSHSLIDLLYHMLNWQDFTLRRLQKIREADPTLVDQMDWRDIDPKIHTWKEGVAAFEEQFRQIKALLETVPESLLEEPVDYRDYNFRHLLNGLIQHNIYHIGQVAYVQKLLSVSNSD